ncbi:hypothetical protein AXF42_Ash015789 [Apostasia shenzhenica]|uniref:DUF4408 domain-containing protein n=1 Tax=Apostasia shenzhenica TaxID=1088818 RepID=A0A2H9ZXM2_9ASPA|nr:hypothetical protein AXF42_Ash015789 [Apostasia shenzhenica]
MAISAQYLRTAGLGRMLGAVARMMFLIVGITATAITIATAAAPYFAGLLSTSLPQMRRIVFIWLAPPYLFITVHFIILVIWKLHGNQRTEGEASQEQDRSNPSESTVLLPTDSADLALDRNMTPELHDGTTPETISSFDPPPDPFPDQLDSGGMSPKVEDGDTLEATWMAIMATGSAASAANRPRMRKSDTWERYSRTGEVAVAAPPTMSARRFRKSETFREEAEGREELFGRAEAFIRTHYEQRRIQRQESEQRFIEMVNAAC